MAWSVVSVGGFPDCAVLALRGELDVSTTAELSSALADVMSRERWVIVDLDGLSFIDCASMRVLACARERTRRAGGDVLLAGARGEVVRLLELTGWGQVFPVFPGVGPAAFSAGLAAVSARLAAVSARLAGAVGAGSTPPGKAVPAGRH